MPTETLIQHELLRYVDHHRQHLLDLLQTLVRTPSENTPPTGAESACQHFCAEYLQSCGLTTDLYELNDIPGFSDHPLYYPGRNYQCRPNLAARRDGSGGGRSLILSGHIDTVPRGTLPWSRDPFSAHIEGNRLYGRGSNDMKAGIAANLFVARALHDLGIPLRGDLTIESIVDEEFGGVNGTLAGRLRGYLADAAVISEPTFLRICPAQRGGRTAQVTFRIPAAGILDDGMEAGIEAQVAWFLSQVPVFAEERRSRAPAHPAYSSPSNPVPVSILKIHTGPWGFAEPHSTANTCKIELFWQTMPGEHLASIDTHFHDWLARTVAARPTLFNTPPQVEFPIRWLPGSAIPASSTLVQQFSASAAAALAAPPPVAGIEGPCDMFIFQQHFNIPAILWGVRGGNTHLADEYVEIDSVIDAAKALLVFVHNWCG